LTGFLQPYLSGPPRDGRPWTILTWAQSLDAKIAPSTRLPMALSSLETKYMTHLIRREVDAILIGAGTAVTDNPSLNGKCRLDNQRIDWVLARYPIYGLEGDWRAARLEQQPRPVIIDPHCRAPLPNLLQLVSSGHAKSPWILCREGTEGPNDRYIPVKEENERFRWSDILSTLAGRGIESLMIEGGANVISDVLSAGVADVVITTIVPVFLGRDAVAVAPSLEVEWLGDVRSISLAKDIVVAGRIQR